MPSFREKERVFEYPIYRKSQRPSSTQLLKIDGILHFDGTLEFSVTACLVNPVKIGRHMKSAEEQRFADSLEFERIMLQPSGDIQDGGFSDHVFFVLSLLFELI
jgi:hypothetical protein